MANEAGKGDDPRPMAITREEFDSNWDAIFANAPLICTACNTEPCDCQGTEDGPGQCANGCPRETPYGDAVCGDCLARSLEDGPGQDEASEWRENCAAARQAYHEFMAVNPHAFRSQESAFIWGYTHGVGLVQKWTDESGESNDN